MVAIIFLALLATLLLAGDTPVGRCLHHMMVELPATALNRISRGHVLFAGLLIGLIGMITWYGHADGVQMLTMALPDAAAWLATFEVSAYLDMLVALAAASVLMRLGTACSAISSLVTPLLKRGAKSGARSRCSRRHAAAAAANDDEDGAGLTIAS